MNAKIKIATICGLLAFVIACKISAQENDEMIRARFGSRFGPIDLLMLDAHHRQSEGHDVQIVGFLDLREKTNSVLVSSWREFIGRDDSHALRIAWREGALTKREPRHMNGAFVAVVGRFRREGKGIGILEDAREVERLKTERLSCESVRRNPLKYSGVWIEVVGYHKYDGEKWRLYPTLDSYIKNRKEESILLETHSAPPCDLAADGVRERPEKLTACEGLLVVSGEKEKGNSIGTLEAVWAFRIFEPEDFGFPWTK
jgi:hypothetical protein